MRELTRKLEGRDLDPDGVRAVVDELCRAGLLSDERFTQELLRVRMRNGYGPARVAAELRHKGVEETLVGRYVDFAAQEWIEPLRQLCGRRFGAASATGDQWVRQAKFLQTRGYTLEQIRAVIGNLGS